MKPWDKSDYAEFKDMHTVVTMVQKDARGKDTKMKEILQGSVAEIFSTKVNGELPARILISAPAGRGKTTAVAKMAYDWLHREKGSALELLPLLFVVKFRNTSQLTSIGEAIKSQLLSDVDDLTPEGLESFIRENQGICHIILDGLDEYAGISSSNRSSESNMVSVILWEEFPECRVLVTTRPHLESFFNQDDLPRVYTKMWIEGFSQESSREYIDKFFASTSKPCRGHGLKVYLDDQPLINELVKTPLFCLMVCHLWSKERLNTETETQTELLDSVNVFLMHHANARAKSKDEITKEELIEIIRNLGKVALAGLIDDSKKLVFTPHDFRRVPAILDRACELGILSKATIPTTLMLPLSHNTTSTTIEFYHKLVQEHSAGKYLAAKTKKYMLRLKISKLDRLLRNITANIGDYENLIRFAAGADNSLCIRIMEALLSNRYLDESERYRILLDCSSETRGTEGNVSSLVQRCVTAQSIVLKSPTVYTVVGMQYLPKQLKLQVRTVKLEGSTLTTDVTTGLWTCLKAFWMLDTLIISDSSLSFPPSPPELPYVTKLSAKRVTSQSYKGVLSSIPGVRDIDVSIDVAETSNTFQITTASRPMNQTKAIIMDEQFFVHIRLHALTAPTTDKNIESEETIGGLSLLFEDQTKKTQRLHVSGVRGRDEEALVDLFVKTKQLTYLNSGFPPSPPELPSVTKLSAKRVTSQSYKEVLSSISGVRDIDVSIDVTETSNTFQITTASRPMNQTKAIIMDEQFFVHIRLHALPALTADRKIESGETIGGLSLLFEDQTQKTQRLHVSGVRGRDEEALVDLFVKTKQLTYLNSGSGGGSLNRKNTVQNTRLQIEQCQLSTEMTEKLLSCFKSFTSLNHLTISDSSLSFPPSPPELPSVTKLSADRVTSQSYEGLLSSLHGLEEIDITIGDTRTEDISQIQTSLRRHQAGQDLTRIDLSSLQSEENVSSMSRMRMRGLGLLITECQAILSGVVFGLQDAVIDLVQSSTRLMSASLYFEQFSGSLNSAKHVSNIDMLTIKDCQLPTEMTEKLLSCFKSFTSLNHLTISDSSLSFPPSPPELPSVTKLSAKRVTSQSYKEVLSSISGVRDIDVSIDVTETSNTFQITTASRPMNQTKAIIMDEQFFVHIRLHALPALTADRKIESGETIGGLSLLFEDQTQKTQRLHVSGVRGRDEEALVDLFVKTKQLTYLNSGSGGGSLNRKNTVQNTRLQIEQCQLSTEMTEKLLSCFKSFTSLNHLTISDSSLSFPPSPPELPSVTKLSAERVTSQSYEGLLSSLHGLEEIDITIGDARTEDISQIQTSLRRHLAGQDLTRIDLSSLQSEENVSSMSRMRMRGLGLLVTECQAILSGVVFGLEDAVINLVQSSTRLMSASLYVEEFSGSLKSNEHALNIENMTIKDCQLSTELCSCLRSFTSLNHLIISDSSLSFPPSPPELPSVTKLSAKKVTSQSYEGLLSSLPGLKDIDITIDDAERDIPQITACLRRTGGQQLTRIDLTSPSSLPTEKSSVSRETMRGLGLLIREQTKDLQRLCLSGIKCLDEEDLVELVESSTYLKALDSLHLQSLDGGCFEYGRESSVQVTRCRLSTEITARMWSCLRSFTSLNHLIISDSSLSFPPSPPELPSVTKLSAKKVTSQSYEGLLSSLPGLKDIDITIDDAERDIPQITACLRRTGGQQLTRIDLTSPSSLPTEKSSVSRETMRGLGLLIREQTKDLQRLCLSGIKCLDEEDLVELVESSTYLKALDSLHLQSLDGGCFEYGSKSSVQVTRCRLSTEITARMWSCLGSLTSLNHLTISDSSLSFPPSPPELPSVTKLSAERVTSQSYEGLLSSLPGLRDIGITIDDAERDIAQITAGLRRTGGQQLTRIDLTTPDTLPSEKSSVSRETMRGLGLLIREQTKNLQWLGLYRVICTDEEDLVYLIECCRHVKKMSELRLYYGGTREGGRLESHLKGLHASGGDLSVWVIHNYGTFPEYYSTHTD
ncbi:uncharacterized protein LOC105440679 [Strongylocentrotus purpuratus]|uniref:NACHT domain-containing protein n=1 Tax=Strongylocentrotus purpuratus TaxID=7668 RepID=A0A7M7PDP4_STRPU|nr:uncharacterized protein LOC105440679 [Strongylocentrotus purpuratus]